VSRKKTRQEMAADQPERCGGGCRAKKRKVEKPYRVYWRVPLERDVWHPIAHEWHGYKRYETMELAEAYVLKRQRTETLVKYEYQIVIDN